MLRYLEAAPEGRQPVQSGEKHCANQKPFTAKQAQRATPAERLFQRRHWPCGTARFNLSSRCSPANYQQSSTTSHINRLHFSHARTQHQCHFLYGLDTRFVGSRGLSSTLKSMDHARPELIAHRIALPRICRNVLPLTCTAPLDTSGRYWAAL